MPLLLTSPLEDQVNLPRTVPHTEDAVGSLELSCGLQGKQFTGLPPVGLDPTTTSSLVKLVSTIVYARSGLE